MALLQLAEPGQSAAPHQHRLAVGIDLGTTNSLVATVRHGLAEVLRDEEGRALLPSIVRYLPDGTTEVGHVAQAHQASDPRNAIVSVKRFMGRGVKDVAHVENLTCRTTSSTRRACCRSRPWPASRARSRCRPRS